MSSLDSQTWAVQHQQGGPVAGSSLGRLAVTLIVILSLLHLKFVKLSGLMTKTDY